MLILVTHGKVKEPNLPDFEMEAKKRFFKGWIFMVIYLLDLKVGVVEVRISFFDHGADQVGMDLGKGRSQVLNGGPFPAIGQDDVAQIFVRQGVVMEGMLHGL